MTAVAEARVLIPYTPRPLQRVLHQALDRHRWAVAVCHRRFGKTVLAVNHLQKQALLCPRPRPRFAYLAPFRNQGKQIAWDYLKHYAGPIPGHEVNESELRIDYPNGGQVRIYGADNEDALRGIYLDGVVLDEYGLMSDTVWEEVIRPTLSDREGWAFFIGTPNGKNQFYKMAQNARTAPGWFYAAYKASETGVLPDAELVSARSTMTADAYAQEYECSFEASVKGAVFARELQIAREQGRITLVPHDPRLTVDTDWDLGHDDSTAIWFSQTSPGGEVRLIDYYEASQYGLDHYAGVLSEKATRYGYVYAAHWFPHDMEVTELGSGETRLRTMQGLLSRVGQKGGGACLVVSKRSLDEGINAARLLLPRCYFNAVTCQDGLEALGSYRWKPQSEDGTGQWLPVHDWACLHGETKLLTRYGMRQIMDLPMSGEVLTPCGWKPYENPRITRSGAPLVEVQFDDGCTVRCTPEHLFLTAENEWIFASDLRGGSLIQSSLTRSRSISMGISTVCGRVSGTLLGAAHAFTAMCGRRRLVRFQAVATSIIAMGIRAITQSLIWSVFQRASTSLAHGVLALPSTPSTSLRPLALALPHGTLQMRAEHGIDGRRGAPKAGRNGSALRNLASIVGRQCRHWSELAMRKSTAPTLAKPLRIASVRPIQDTADVWCITVPDGHWYALENGAVVHNSHGADAFRTMAVRYFTPKVESLANKARRDYDPDDARWGRGRQIPRGSRGGY